MHDNLIGTRHLSIVRDNRTVFSNIGVSLHAGEFVAVVGKSGAGKSTLLHAIAGHLPHVGEIHAPEHIGMVFQQFALYPWLTAKENVAFGLRMEPSERARWTSECLHLAGLEAKAAAYPTALSGGEQQRIAIARAIAHKPDLLLMDEPFGSLDALTREAMQDWLLGIWEERKTTVMMVTHNIEEALLLASRVLVLAHGQIVEDINVPLSRPRKREAMYSSLAELQKKVRGAM